MLLCVFFAVSKAVCTPMKKISRFLKSLVDSLNNLPYNEINKGMCAKAASAARLAGLLHGGMKGRVTRRMAKPKIKDIALRAGVSPATVSNALNGRAGVSEAVVQRIRQIAEEVGYVAPRARMSEKHPYVRLVVYKSHGMVVLDTHFFAELIEGIQSECQRSDMELMITHISAAKDKDYKQRIREVCSEDCMGILLLGTEMNAEDLALFSPCSCPLVVLDNLFRHEDVHSVVMNNYEAGFKAVDALYHAGHRSIGHITSSIQFSNVRYRRKGYEAAMVNHGLSVSEDSLWRVSPSIEGAYADMLTLLDQGRKPPSAFFAANDLMAIGSIRALSERGWRVPEDISIIGMDDTAVCLACTPMLTTIRVSRRDMSTTAVRILLCILPGLRQSVIKTEIGVQLIWRDSVRKVDGNNEEG